jgi:hypothetical protein
MTITTNLSPNLATFLDAAIPTPFPMPTATAHLDTSMCSCGQDLDVHRSRHCPRCGITLPYPHPLIPAA